MQQLRGFPLSHRAEPHRGARWFAAIHIFTPVPEISSEGCKIYSGFGSFDCQREWILIFSLNKRENCTPYRRSQESEIVSVQACHRTTSYPFLHIITFTDFPPWPAKDHLSLSLHRGSTVSYRECTQDLFFLPRSILKAY